MLRCFRQPTNPYLLEASLFDYECRIHHSSELRITPVSCLGFSGPEAGYSPERAGPERRGKPEVRVHVVHAAHVKLSHQVQLCRVT